MKFTIHGTVQRFSGKLGWHYVELDEQVSVDIRPMVKRAWPALVKARFTLGRTEWEGSIMPIKDGPLFVALPARVREKEAISMGDAVSVDVALLA